jgi:hypothetical protein
MGICGQVFPYTICGGDAIYPAINPSAYSPIPIYLVLLLLLLLLLLFLLLLLV